LTNLGLQETNLGLYKYLSRGTLSVNNLYGVWITILLKEKPILEEP